MLSQTLTECVNARRVSGGETAVYVSYPGDFRWLLRLGEMDGSES